MQAKKTLQKTLQHADALIYSYVPVRDRKLRDRDARVLDAIKRGPKTQEEIRREAKVETIDEVGLALAELLVHRKIVKSFQTPEGDRVYFLNPNPPFSARSVIAA